MWSSFRTHRKSLTLLIISTIFLCLAVFVLPGIVNSANREEVILVTAFEPFGSHQINSSWEVVRRLEGKKIHGHRIVTVRLPVVWAAAWSPVQTAIDQFQPRLVISVGQGATNRLELAHSARNIYGKSADSAGIRMTSDVITLNGPDHFDTRIQLDSIVNRLSLNGITANVAPHAGDYVCNFISYRSYEYLSQKYPNTATFFVHVPAVSTVETPDDQSQLNQLTDALTIIVDSASQQVAS
jgi:pyroglutamyl-peptidase